MPVTSPVGHGAVARGSAPRGHAGLSIGPLGSGPLGLGSGLALGLWKLEYWNVGRFFGRIGFQLLETDPTRKNRIFTKNNPQPNPITV